LASAAKGAEAKKPFLEKFLVFQMREANKKTVTAEKTFVSHENRYIDRVWMSQEVMDRKVGASKAQKWRASGKIPSRCDSVTLSMDPDDIEWGVPKEWQRFMDGESNTATLAGKAAATKEDGEMFGVEMEDSTTNVDDSHLTIKVEPKTAVDEWREKVEDFNRDKKHELLKMQGMQLEMKQIHAKMSNAENAYLTKIIEDVSNHVNVLSELVVVLERYNVVTIIDEQGLPEAFQQF
jgi:hypothetical protein